MRKKSRLTYANSSVILCLLLAAVSKNVKNEKCAV